MITIDSNLWLLNLLQKRLFYKNFRNKEKTWTTIILLLPSSKKGWLNNNRKIKSGSIFIIVHVVSQIVRRIFCRASMQYYLQSNNRLINLIKTIQSHLYILTSCSKLIFYLFLYYSLILRIFYDKEDNQLIPIYFGKRLIHKIVISLFIYFSNE